MHWSAKCGECVQRVVREDCLVGLNHGQGGESVVLGKGVQIQCIVPDGNGDMSVGVSSSRYYTEWQVVDGEMVVGIDA